MERCIVARGRSTGVPTALLCAVSAFSLRAEITVDGSLGPAMALEGPDYQIGAELGQIRGTSLFQSFGAFNLSSTESATFSGPDFIANVLGRVTGGGISYIDGAINSQIPGANLYVLNPNGFVFGPNATLNVSGSFHASSADYIRLGDAGRFDAARPSDSVLVSAPPAAFGFLGSPGTISVDRSVLEVADRATLSLVGGDVSISGVARSVDGQTADPGQPGFDCAAGCLRARGGRVQVGSGSAGSELSVDLSTVGASGTDLDGEISLVNRSFIDVSGNAGGTTVIRAGSFLSENAGIRADSGAGAATQPVAVDIAVAGDAVLRETAIVARSTGAAPAGAIRLAAGAGLYADGGQIVSVAEASGDAGTVTLEASRVGLQNGAQVRSDTGIGRGGRGSGSGGGSGGGGGSSATTPAAAGRGGDVIIRAEQEITLRQEVAVGANSNSEGDAGDVYLEAPVIEVLDGSRVGSNSDAEGDSGALRLVATERLVLAGTNGKPDPARNRGSRITVGSRSTATGDAGSIFIQAPRVVIGDGSRISSSTSGIGQGGAIDILASDSVTLSGARLDGDGSSIRASTEVEANQAADNRLPRTSDAGPIFIRSGRLTLGPGTEIVSSTSLPGRGGRIDVQVSRLQMSGATLQTISSGAGAGDAGDIGITVLESARLDNSSISTAAAQADGGNIRLAVADTLALFDSEISAQVQGGAGNGGNIAIDPVFVVLNGSLISADAFGGNGGNIRIVSDYLLTTPDSSISASSALGIDGIVDIKAPDADIGKALTALPAGFFDASALLRSRCGARIVTGASSFVLAGPGALPVRPEDPQPSLYPAFGKGAAWAAGASTDAAGPVSTANNATSVPLRQAAPSAFFECNGWRAH